MPLPDRIGTVRFRDLHTWYRINDGSTDGQTPLVILHGGPGCAHNYCLPMANLASRGRTVVMYDQVGCGNSSHLPSAPSSFWSVDLFLDELDNLVDALGLREGFHLLGQSWGGILAAEYAVRDPEGLRGLVLADSPASMGAWRSEASRLIAELPPEVSGPLRAGQLSGDTASTEYRLATEVFYAKHVCRVQPYPEYVSYTFAQVDADPTVYLSMNGPTEFDVNGSLRDWTIIDRLHRVAVPTLVLAGEFDEATPLTWAPFVREIPDVRAHVFDDASHMPHVEQPDEFLDTVQGFFSTVDQVAEQPVAGGRA